MLGELYNLLAEMITYLMSAEDKEFFKRYNSRTSTERKRERDIIYVNVWELFEEDTEHFCELSHKKIREQELLKKIKRLFSNCKEQEDHRCLLRLLEILDSALEGQMLRELESIGENTFEGGLNSNWKELKLGIVPRCVCYWERGIEGGSIMRELIIFLKIY